MYCHNKAVKKLLKEVQLLKDLQHENIIKLRHYCAKTTFTGHLTSECVENALIAAEMGDPVTNLRLLQMTWKERATLIADLARLLDFAQHSPLNGDPLALTDLRRPQFVLVQGHLKLSDLDDIVIGEPACNSDADCSSSQICFTYKFLELMPICFCVDLNVTAIIPCVAGQCKGYSTRLNMQKSYKEFGPYIFIPEGVPYNKKKALEGLQQMWKENVVSTKELLSASLTLL